MSKETEVYLAKVKQNVETNYKANGTPDCYLVYKTNADGWIIGEPLSIFKKFSSLEAEYETICNETDERYGITVGFWWFDDKN